EFGRTDVSLVIGANDVVNPAAKNTPGSPIYGMPVLNVDASQAVVVLKRSMNTGFAGIENELFYDPKTTMLFGDAKGSIMTVRGAVKDVCPLAARGDPLGCARSIGGTGVSMATILQARSPAAR